MNNPVIRVEHIGKKFVISHEAPERYTSLRDVIAERAKGILSRNNKKNDRATHEEFHALHDVNFDVFPGDRIGIIGRNGAGKSTLLKVLSRIVEPSAGKITIKGRVASLLEVGTGFHPELTGRENIFLNGAILGMARGEIRKKFDEIVSFAEIEQFLDTPVKRYSSGMYVRLAFAVAAHLEPDILIVDEVLAVGDLQFQKKCLGKMEDVSERDGRTVIFVSHDMAAISALTRKAIYLKKGKVEIFSDTSEVINHYLKADIIQEGNYVNQKPSSDKPQIIRAEVITSEINNIHRNGRDLRVDLDVNMPYACEGMALSFQIYNDRNFPVIFCYAFDADSPILRTPGLHKTTCFIPDCNLYEGSYYLKLHLAESKGREKFQEVDRVCEFEVRMMDSIIEWGWQKNVCIYTPQFKWTTKQA